MVDGDGRATDRTFLWADQVTTFVQPIIGSGSPEGVVSAEQGMLYINTAGGAGTVLYVKRDGDISRDPTKGWILV